MKGGVLLAWLVGEGIITYRCVALQHRPPLPGQLLASSGLFVVLAMLEGPQPQLARLIAWGIDIAAILNLFGTAAPNSSIGAALEGPSSSAGGSNRGSAPGGAGLASPTVTPASTPTTVTV